MHKISMQFHRHLSLLATSTMLLSCGVFASDGDRYEELDRLRVLAIRAEPADLAVGETTTLNADTYEPAGRELSYEWSWCPSRGDGDLAFECNIPEADLQQAWTAAGLDGEAPSYDLGSDSEAQFTHALAPSLVASLCGSSDVDERVKAACFAQLGASIQLKVRSSNAELTVIKALTLLGDEGAGAARNSNPVADFALTVRDNDGDVVVDSDQPLRAGHRYTIAASVDDSVAELFTPRPVAGATKPVERRETLVMSWFVTVGELAAPKGVDDDGIGDDRARTTFVDGSNRIEDLRKNGWKLPLTAGPNAELRVVLRDERGGVGWTARSFEVVGGEK
jgi:hypothetical protein